MLAMAMELQWRSVGDLGCGRFDARKSTEREREKVKKWRVAFEWRKEMYLGLSNEALHVNTFQFLNVRLCLHVQWFVQVNDPSCQYFHWFLSFKDDYIRKPYLSLVNAWEWPRSMHYWESCQSSFIIFWLIVCCRLNVMLHHCRLNVRLFFWFNLLYLY